MLKLVTVTQLIVSYRYLNKDFVVHRVFLDWKHTFIVLIYGFMYIKSKLIQEFCFQLNPYSERRRKQSVLLKSFRYTRFDEFHPKAVLLKKMFLKSKNIFLHWFLPEIYAWRLIFTGTVIQSYKSNAMNNSNILSLASIWRNLARGFCRVKNVFFCFCVSTSFLKNEG